MGPRHRVAFLRCPGLMRPMFHLHQHYRAETSDIPGQSSASEWLEQRSAFARGGCRIVDRFRSRILLTLGKRVE